MLAGRARAHSGLRPYGRIGMLRREESYEVDEWFMFDLGLAVQNLCLKAHELGLEAWWWASWTTTGRRPFSTCRPTARWWRASPSDARPWRKEGPPRKPLSEFAFIDAHGKPFPG